MSDVWARWEGHIVNGVFPLRRYLGGSDHSGVFLTEFEPQNIPNAALKLVPVIPTLAESQLAHWRTAAAAAHPHLMRILDTGRCQLGEQHFLFFVMEYAEQNLAQLLQRRAMTEEEAREMLLASLDALAFLHSLNLVQGQFKPSNVLVVGDRLMLSSDTVRPAGEANTSISMSSPYDPPEARDGSFSAAGDLWALGITTFEALTQTREGFDGPLPPNFPPILAEIVRRCLSPNPSARPRAREVEGWLKYGLPASQKGASAPAAKSGGGVAAKSGVGPGAKSGVGSATKPDGGAAAKSSGEVAPAQPNGGPTAAGDRRASGAGATAVSASSGAAAVSRQATAASDRSPSAAADKQAAAVNARGTAVNGRGAAEGSTVKPAGDGKGIQADGRGTKGARPGADGAPTRLVMRAVLGPNSKAVRRANPQAVPRHNARATAVSPGQWRSFLPLIVAAVAIVVVGWFTVRAFRGHEPGNASPTPVVATSGATSSSSEQSAPSPASTAAATDSGATHASSSSSRKAASAGSSIAVVHEEIPVASSGARATIRGRIKVSVRVTIDGAGNVIGESLTEPGPSRYFAHLASQAARKWRFAPSGSGSRRECVLRFEFARDGATGRVLK